MPEPKLEFYKREITMAIAVSDHVIEGFPVSVHLPFGDNKQWQGPIPQLADHIEAAATLLADGEHVLVYCHYGRNRSGLVCALIIRELLGCTGGQAFQLLRRSRRGSIGSNQHFVHYLEALAAPTGNVIHTTTEVAT
jgi:protein-tyrosine phosphatase